MKIQIILNEDTSENMTLSQLIFFLIILIGVLGGWAFLISPLVGR